jgi:hypothetical protein
MAMDGSPTFRCRHVAMELQRLRQTANVTLEQASGHLECSVAKLSRMEAARAPLCQSDVRDLLRLYGVTDQQTRDGLAAFACDYGRNGWWQGHQDGLPTRFSIYLGLEAAATSVEVYRSQLMYGLFQTADYARALMGVDVLGLTRQEIDQRVELNLARQELLVKEEPLQVWAILDESVLHRIVGGRAVMRGQLRHLIELAQRPNVTVQLLSFDSGPVLITIESFEVLTFPEPAGPPVVYIEHSTGSLYLERFEDVREYRARIDHLIANGVGLKDTLTRIAAIAGEL